ncbi:hypothetical protein BY996DRAFT_6417023 [Phakopsora pachyrhizi]|nr:hypothetical protein BY996DRAFT_6417023 [Phakopsora pachyrhizi]
MQALNRDWERLLTKSSMNHREVVQGVNQVVSHLKLLKDLLHHDGFQVMPNGLNPILMQALNRDPAALLAQPIQALALTAPAKPSLPCPSPAETKPALYLPHLNQNQETKPTLPAPAKPNQAALPAPAPTKPNQAALPAPAETKLKTSCPACLTCPAKAKQAKT